MSDIKELENKYIVKHKNSRRLYESALECFPSGVTHDNRYVKPFPIYIKNAFGTSKWDVDGNEFVDYVMGHGALLFGYGENQVLTAIQEQIPKSLHIGACTELEIEWAKLIKKLVPNAKKGLVRGTSCGSEAVQMAIRLSRIYTNKDKIVIHAGAYHGKQDLTIYARQGPPFGVYNIRGIPQGIKNDVIIVPFNNIQSVETAFKTGDVACIILHCNALYSREYIEGLRELTTQYGVVFIMDEVVSGFRYSAGGAQQYYNVTPDLTALGKIIGGGIPVGALCGNEEIMELYSYKDPYWNKFIRVAVGGTWNAQPASIVGGIAMMKIIYAEKDKIYPTLYKIGKRLVNSFNEIAEDNGLAALAYGLPIENPTTITINLFKQSIPSNKLHLWQIGPSTFEEYDIKSKYSADTLANYVTYLSMMNNGVFSYSGRGGSLCTKYTEEDIRKTEDAFDTTLTTLKINNLIGRNT